MFSQTFFWVFRNSDVVTSVNFTLYQIYITTHVLYYFALLEPILNNKLIMTNEFRHDPASAPRHCGAVSLRFCCVAPPSPHRLFILDLFCAGFLFFGMGGWSRAGFSLKGETGGILSASIMLSVLPRVYHILYFVGL